jgi:hypothetical protein
MDMREMQKILVIIYVLININLYSQCPTSNLTLTSQAQVNSFSTSYPSCTNLTYRISIQGSDIIDLSPLSNITELQELIILNTSIVHFNSFPNLIKATSILIAQNTLLESISGFDKVPSVGLAVQSNPKLASIGGFSNVNEIALYLQSNPELSIIRNFSNIQISSLLISRSKLQDLGFLSGATGIPSFVTIKNNPNLNACSVPIICNYLNSVISSYDYWNGSISGNDSGCTFDQVWTSCSNRPFGYTGITLPAYSTTVKPDTDFQWTPDVNATGYKIKIGYTFDGNEIILNGSDIINIDVGNVTSYNLPYNLPSSPVDYKSMYLEVTPYNSNGDAQFKSVTYFNVEPTALPITLSLFSGYNNNGQNILKW